MGYDPELKIFTAEPYSVPEYQIARSVLNLEPGEVVFIESDNVCMNPETAALSVLRTASVHLLEDVFDMYESAYDCGEPAPYVARLICVNAGLVLDSSFTQELISGGDNVNIQPIYPREPEEMHRGRKPEEYQPIIEEILTYAALEFFEEALINENITLVPTDPRQIREFVEVLASEDQSVAEDEDDDD